MGFMSRKFLPECSNVCLCCPTLTPSSRRPVKRYKKLLAEIFPKKLDGSPNERKIVKLCEYAAKNHIRIPKIVKFLEQKYYKELRNEHVNFIKIIMEVYSKLLYLCKEQMAYFAGNLLNVIVALLDAKQRDSLRILGCQTLSKFIYCQADTTYAQSLETLVPKVSRVAREEGGEHNGLLCAASLQCLSAMVWFMKEYSYFFADFNEIIHAILENYGIDDADDGLVQRHNWVDEVTRCDARIGPQVLIDVGPNNLAVRLWPETQDTSMLTREERESPKVWSQICIQKLSELAKETTTMRCILDPMFNFFDMGRHWAPHQGLALNVLSDMAHLSKSSGTGQFVLVALIHHVDHKNISCDPLLKSSIVQIATCLVKQLRVQSVVAEIGIASDLCRHLRKSLQASTMETIGPEEASWHISLQASIEDCLLEIAKGIGDAVPLFDMMAITLEKLSNNAVAARATIGSLLILAHIISLSSRTHSQFMFPEALLLQLLQAMLHPDVEVRLGAHLLFWVILARTSIFPRNESESLLELWKRHPRTMSAFASTTALFEKLRREREGVNEGRNRNDESNLIELNDDERKHGWLHKCLPYFHKLNFNLIDRTGLSTYKTETEANFITLTEDQIAQLLSSFWRQAHQPDNLPSNYEAIAHSFCLTLLSSHHKNQNHNSLTPFFHLPLSLINASLDINCVLPPTSQRSVITLSLGMLAFAGKVYKISHFVESLKFLISCHIDPYLGIGDDLQFYARTQSNMKEYGSEADQEASISVLVELRKRMVENDYRLIDIVVQHLSGLTNMNENDMTKQLSETFTPEDEPFYSAFVSVGWDSIPALTISEESLSFDEEHSRTSSLDDDMISESPSTDFPKFVPKMLAPPPMPQFVNVGQLLESALHVAGQVAATSVSTSPLPYGTMASHCEAFDMGTRKKLSAWLVSSHDSVSTLQAHSLSNKLFDDVSVQGRKEMVVSEPWWALKLPPASPFDNFMRAAGC